MDKTKWREKQYSLSEHDSFQCKPWVERYSMATAVALEEDKCALEWIHVEYRFL